MRYLIALIVSLSVSVVLLGSDVLSAGEGKIQTVSASAGSRHILMFTAPWCGACQNLKKSEFPALIEKNWKIGLKQSDQIQVVDADKHPKLMEKYGIESLPTLVLEVDGKVVDKRGYLDAYQIVELYHGRLK